MTLTTLVIGGDATHREAAIAALIDPQATSALILEGLPSGSTGLTQFGKLPTIQIAHIAPGCPCCLGNLTMRVTLNRMLRRPSPANLFIGLAVASHLDQIKAFLTAPPYNEYLTLTDDLFC